MNARTYQAVTMAEALAEVKRDLGRDAVILHTRNFRKGGLLGLLGGRNMWEITAAPNINLPRRAGEYAATPQPSAGKQLLTVAASMPATANDDSSAGQIGQIKHMLETLIARGRDDSLPQELAFVREALLAQDVSEPVTDRLLGQIQNELTGQQLADKALVSRQVKAAIASMIPTTLPQQHNNRRKVICLIGPTGVGKTTTIAKLAANYKLRDKKKVGLITIDTYRIAAVDQLRTYAEIIEIPLRIVLTAGELHQAVQSMKDLDVVLIDTAGRSQNDSLRLNQLRAFIAAAQADEVHLAVAATANHRCAVDILTKFMPLGANRIVITKLDEAITFGMILNLAVAAKSPLSFVTAGQDVPDDIAPADANYLADLIVAGVEGGQR